MISSLLFMVLSITYPFQCLEELEPLHHIEAGAWIWDIEDETWNLPDDIERVHRPIRGDGFEIWFRYSPHLDKYFVWVFDDLESVHTCEGGYGAISPGQYLEVLEVWDE